MPDGERKPIWRKAAAAVLMCARAVISSNCHCGINVSLYNLYTRTYTVFDLISEHALISGHPPFFYFFYFNINNYFK